MMRSRIKVFDGPPRITAPPDDTSNKSVKQRTASIKRTVPASTEAGKIVPAKFPPKRRRKRELWRNVKIPKTSNMRLLQPPALPPGQRFETMQDALRINASRVRRLMNCRPDIAAKIERCEGQAAPGSLPICARAARRYRLYDTAERLRFAKEYYGPHQIATIYLRAFPAGQLHTANLRLAQNALRKILQREEFKGSILIGGTEVAWLAKHGLWVLHCHLLAIGADKSDWDRLRAALPDAGPAAALKVQVLKDLPEQLSCCQKFNSSHKPGKRGPGGKVPYRPLPTERLIEWAEWMSKQRFEDFGFNFGARRRGGKIFPEA